MQLNLSDLNRLKKVASEAVLKAGQAIIAMAGSNLDVIKKDSGSTPSSQVVTEVDFKSQEIILELLEETCHDFDIGLLSEEKEDDQSRLQKDYFWAIDPLDGTLSFIEYKNGYAVSISLVSKAGLPVIGVVYDPVSNSLFQAIEGQGAHLNGRRFTAANNSNHETCYLICDRTLNNHINFSEIYKAFCSEAEKLGYKYVKTICNGGAVMNACWSMINSPSCFFKFPKNEQGGGCIWDFGATACIYKESGGIVSDCFGEPLILNSRQTVFMNKRGIIYATSKEFQKIITKLYSDLMSK